MKKRLIAIAALGALGTLSCGETSPNAQQSTTNDTASVALKPFAVTDSVVYDTDDPAIWVHPSDPSKSLIVGTDKEEGGGIYVFDLHGKIVNKITGLKRPNNIDIIQGFPMGDSTIDIAVFTERKAEKIRVFELPSLKPIDNGGIDIFEGETCDECREGMGLALYQDPATKTVYAVVGRKNGVDGSYLWQYELKPELNGKITATVVRKFGKYSGKKEIEAIAVDNELGYIYYSDEGTGVRKYYAHPSKGDQELALFATSDFARDHEGISIYKNSDTTGYIIVSDQQANAFNIYPREGVGANPHQHNLITKIKTVTHESDGNEVSSKRFGNLYPYGFFVAMDDHRVFHIYDWRDFQQEINKALRK